MLAHITHHPLPHNNYIYIYIYFLIVLSSNNFKSKEQHAHFETPKPEVLKDLKY